MGNNYREVDLTANALINVGAIHESSALNSSTYSTNSTTKTLYTFQSDTIGNITNVSGANLNWNGRRLESISVGGTDLISYKYNIDGQRISKTVNGVTTEYFYNGDILAGQKTGDDVLIFMYDNNGDIFGFTYNGTPYYYVKNAQNDVFMILNGNGQPAVLYQYDAWGKVIGCLDGTEENIASINPITYRSYYMDFDLGFFMYYLNSRYYMADWGRFVSADNLLDDRGMTTQNLFQYCANNPVMYADASGHALESIFDVLTLCISIVDVMANPTDPWAWLGLAGDIVDLVPFVTGVGEATKGLKLAYKAVDALDAAYDAARAGDKVADAVNNGRRVANTVDNAKDTSNVLGSVCFVAGTKVLTDTGLVSIEDISSGEWVWAENPDTGEKELKQVVQTFINETSELVHVYVNDEEIIATPEHPFYVPNKGWTSAIELRAGDILVLQNGKYVIVEKIQHEILETPVTVYNFEVEDFHTYYVGNSSVLVHNACSVPTNELQATHELTKSSNQLNKLISDIKVNGIQEPIKYVNFEGTKYIVDGHHRTYAAKILNMPYVPAVEVTLPYAGYKTVGDLLWW